MSERALKWVTAGLLAALFAGLAIWNQANVGIARDEVVYMNAGRSYATWWSKLATFEDGTVSEKAIGRHFGGAMPGPNNPEHPPLMKTLFGLSEKVFEGSLGKVRAQRLPNAIFLGLLVAMVFLFARRAFGYPEALAAALLLGFMPRLLFHAGLAAFDAPMVTVWFAAIYAYYRSLSSPWKWGIGFGVFFGLCLATKHNAIMLPAAIVVHWSWVVLRELRQRRAELPNAGTAALLGRSILARGPLTIPAIAIIGPLVLIALWPWLWFDTFEHIGAWLGFHFKHVHYNFEYLGTNWNHPPFPWHVVFVTTFLTVPVVTLVAAVTGTVALVVRWRRGESVDPERGPALLLFLSAGVAMGAFLIPTTPIFGAEKHWATAMPTVAIYAGVGLVLAARLAAARLAAVGRAVPERPLVVGLAALAVTAAAVETFDAQPHALSHYNALAGGAPGGADLGMNRQFWGISARGVLPYIDRVARETGSDDLLIYFHDAEPAWGIYHHQGRIPRGVRRADNEYRGGIRCSDLAIVIHERHFNRHDYLIWDQYGTVQPAFVLTTDGVPIVSVYRRPPSRPRPKCRRR